MYLTFNYSHDKDVENFIKSFSSKNSKIPTKLQQAYILVHGEIPDSNLVSSFLKGYIENQNIDIRGKATEIQKQWILIENEFVKRVEALFGVKLSHDIAIYLSTNSRCTYNMLENYFFLYMDSKSTNHIIMHELLHFYTWHSFGKRLIEEGLSKEAYNDIKESLTELLNIEFADLMPGVTDTGYPQHQEMRKEIRDAWSKSKNIETVIVAVIKKP